VEALHQNALTDFSRHVGGIGILVVNDESATSILKFLHRVESFPGTPGHSRDPMTSLCYEGGVSGCDISTVAFDENQLAVTPDAGVPGSYERVLQLLHEEPSRERALAIICPRRPMSAHQDQGGVLFPLRNDGAAFGYGPDGVTGFRIDRASVSGCWLGSNLWRPAHF
jgi:hypothetical protein